MAAALALAWTSCAEEPCKEDAEKLEECGLQFRSLTCETGEGSCVIDCYARQSCGALDALFGSDDWDPPLSLSRCLARCQEPFRCDEGATTIDARWRCDGEADCVDRADEAGCNYHTCEDGQLVRDAARCDDYPDCEDGSDEEGC